MGVWASLVNTAGPACIPAVVRRGAWEGKVKKAGGFLHGRCTAIRSWLPAGTCRPGGGPGAQSDRPLGSVSHDPMTSSLRTESGSLALLFRSGAPVVWPACSSPTGCRRARTPNLPFVPMSVGQVICLGSRLDLSRFLPGTPVSVSRGSLLSPSLLESGSLMDCAVGQTLQILQQCPRDPQTCTHRCLGDVLNMRIRIFYVRENVRESEYSTLEKTLGDRSHVARISSLRQPKCTGEKTKGKSGAAGVFVTFVQIQLVLHDCFSFRSVCPRSCMNSETKP